MANEDRDDDAALSQDEIDQFKVRIEFGDRGEQPTHGRVIKELVELRDAAEPLIPTIIDQFRSGHLQVANSTLIELILSSRSEALFEALKGKGVFQQLTDTSLECKLLEGGHAEFEDRLLEYLWTIWLDSANPRRRAIVESLGRAGGAKALRVLKAILPELAGKLQEQNVKVKLKAHEDETREREIVNVDIKGLEASADQSLLDCLRAAIRLMGERGIH
jgi:hypothetical protein